MQGALVDINLNKIKKYVYIGLGIYAFVYIVASVFIFLSFWGFFDLYDLVFYLCVALYPCYAFFMVRGVFLLSKLSTRVFVLCLLDLFLSGLWFVAICSGLIRIVSLFLQEYIFIFKILKFFIALNYAFFMWELFKISRGKFFLYSALLFAISTFVHVFINITYLFDMFFQILAFLSLIVAWISFKQIHLKENYG